jgi:hypothetical protein
MSITLKTLYTNFATKKAMVEQVANNCITYDNDMMIVDYAMKEMGLSLSLLQFYTDIDMESPEFNLDKMYEEGQIDELKKQLPISEWCLLTEMLDGKIDEMKTVYNSIAGVLNRNLNKLISKIPTEKEMSKLLKSLQKTLEKVSPETLSILKDISAGKIK